MQSSDTKKVTGAQLRAGRALLRWSADDLAAKSGVGLATIRRAELIDGKTKMTGPNESAVRAALEAAGIEFTNGGQPGVRVNSSWMLHQVTDRAGLEEQLKDLDKAKVGWTVRKTPKGLECLDQSGRIIGTVAAPTANNPSPVFDPPIGDLHFADRVVPNELREWLVKIALEQ